MRGWKAREKAARARQHAREDRRRIREIRAAHIASLDADEADVPEQVEVPADWRDLSWPKLRSVASKLSDDTIKTKDDAIAAIEAHLDGNTAPA